MKKIFVAALALGALSAPAFAEAPAATAPTAAVKGKVLLASDGARLGSIYRVADEGAQLIVDGRMITVPTNTINTVGGKLTTSLTKRQVIALR